MSGRKILFHWCCSMATCRGPFFTASSVSQEEQYIFGRNISAEHSMSLVLSFRRVSVAMPEVDEKKKERGPLSIRPAPC